MNKINFLNGIYDVTTNKFTYSENAHATPNTNIIFKPYDKNDVTTQQVEKFIDDLFPTNLHHAIDMLTDIVTRKNRRLRLLYGPGGNGKSTLLSLLIKSFGTYVCQLPAYVLDANTPNIEVELARIKDKLIVIFQEIDPDTQIDTALINQVLSDNPILVRQFDHKAELMTPVCQLFLETNAQLNIANPQLQSKIHQINFDTKFVHQVDPNKPNEKQVNTTLHHNMHNWTEAFVSIIFKFADTIIDNKIRDDFDLEKKIMALCI